MSGIDACIAGENCSICFTGKKIGRDKSGRPFTTLECKECDDILWDDLEIDALRIRREHGAREASFLLVLVQDLSSRRAKATGRKAPKFKPILDRILINNLRCFLGLA